ncbi:uncharacterized protein LOC142979382 isoform X1 [Anticarsia gemmatalis]|uniref:uncharacterized protein LOC142979241 isoform X1 n=1 Tax=Anticarsia gemmatalis TaxID=129554 RepID=UPI003F764BB1
MQRESLKVMIANRYGSDIAKQIRDLEYLRRKRARVETSLIFLTKCRDWNLLPTCVRIKPRSDIAHSRNILNNASERLLRQLIRNKHSELNRIHSELYVLHVKCSVSLSREDYDLCDRVTYLQASRTFELCSETHERKFSKEYNRRYVEKNTSPAVPDPLTKTVVNLSNVSLDQPTMNILAKGMNFALTPKRIPFESVISSVEETIARNKIPPGDADTLRQDVAVILRKSKVPASNTTAEERQALKLIRDNRDILVLKADKGNATVVMNTTDYQQKVRDLLCDNKVYKPVSYNPTTRVTRRIRTLIQDNKDLFTEDEYERLYKPKSHQPPKLYGLPKIHKSNVPLRPIVSQIASPTYDLAKYVASVLQPLVGNTPSFVKDSRHFVQIIKDLRLESGDVMVSFDVESLFTNVPIKECLDVVKTKLEDNEMPFNYIDLLKNCLDGNYFLFQGQHYLQIDGVAMGSPVAPALANLWMEHFEEKALALGPKTIRLWKRYVDDIFCIIQGGQQEVDQYLEHLNSIHPKMRFTYEMETDRSLSFLDVRVAAKPDGSLSHCVYRKPTHTDRYLHATSHHHPRHLQSVMTSLKNRAHDLCDPEHVGKELEHVQEVLRMNGYHVSRRRNRITKRSKHPEVNRQPAYLPYVRGVTDKIGNVLKQYSISTVFTPGAKVSSMVGTPKDVLPFQTPGVYKINCSCGSSYIGQTKRSIAERVKEHIAAVKNRQISKSAIAEHLLEAGTNHWIEFHRPQVLSTERHFYSRIVREAIEIKKHPNFNREDGFKLSATWNPVITVTKPRYVSQSVSSQNRDTVSVVCVGGRKNQNMRVDGHSSASYTRSPVIAAPVCLGPRRVQPAPKR